MARRKTPPRPARARDALGRFVKVEKAKPSRPRDALGRFVRVEKAKPSRPRDALGRFVRVEKAPPAPRRGRGPRAAPATRTEPLAAPTRGRAKAPKPPELLPSPKRRSDGRWVADKRREVNMASGYASKHGLESTQAALDSPAFQKAMSKYRGSLAREQRARDRGDRAALLRAKMDQLDMLLAMDMLSQEEYDYIIASPSFAD